jgi:hypothetical protein
MRKLILVTVFAAFVCLMSSPFPFNQLSAQNNGASHVRWDIISLNFTTTPFTVSAGGVAFASVDPDHLIKLTGSGTFVAPASGGTSSGVTGGGTWETFGPGGVSTGSGTFEVIGLASWQFAQFQTPGSIIDDIDAQSEAADGNVILRIRYSDGSQGVLGVGCDGPPSPAGILEGVIATKGFFTYWNRGVPAAGVDANRTIFHVN